MNPLTTPSSSEFSSGASRANRSRKAHVAIVGAGPGDPELLTLKALRRLQGADIVVYDALVGPEILSFARSDAELVYVGKQRGKHSCSQAEINALVARHAKQGRRVVRLKGGDPFVFGRGGEEVDHLAQLGISVEIVPGITAATACGAVAGIPLTHRDYASAVTFVSGHGKNGEPALDWRALARPHHTLVVYMGLHSAASIAERLTANGRGGDTPVAVVERGSLPDERILFGRLAGLADLVAQHDVRSPALIVVGEVVAAAAARDERTLARERTPAAPAAAAE